MNRSEQFPVIISVAGEQRRLLTNDPSHITLAEAQAVVGGYVQLIPLYPGWVLLCNEDGVRDCSPNYAATAKFFLSLPVGACLHGDVIVCPEHLFK